MINKRFASVKAIHLGMLIFLGMILSILLLTAMATAKDKCSEYIQEVRIQHIRYFGLSFPYGYGVGQLITESRCRPNITAFDGGQGLTQFMPKTEEYIESLMDEKLNMYNPYHAIKAQAFYMSRLHQQNSDGRLFLTYMFYNSGAGTVKKEVKKAGSYDYQKMRKVCKRKVLTLKSGQLLDLCDVGYAYPIHIYNNGIKYNKTSSSEWRYW